MNFLSSRQIAIIVITAILICLGQIIWLSLNIRTYQKEIAVYKIIVQQLLAKIRSTQHQVSVIEPNVDDLKVNPSEIESLITINNETDIQIKRKKLIDFIWGKSSYPSSMPSNIQKNIHDERYLSIHHLKTIHRLTINMDFDLHSIVYLFMPIHATQTLIIYHQGHSGDFILGTEFIQCMLNEGYAVAAFSMPLLGMNNQPVVNLKRFGKFKLTDHDHLKLLQPEKGHPIQYFLTPVVEMINVAESFGFKNIVMTGISGGGWTCTMIAAIDDRITRSYPVAGTLPLYLRSGIHNNWGDYEQTIPEIYRIANYLELYIMGAYGNNRKQIQVINIHDPCCFNGNTYQSYHQIIKKQIQYLKKGSFDVFPDKKNQTHSISQISIHIMVNDIRDAFFSNPI
jgi:hypothetical protein